MGMLVRIMRHAGHTEEHVGEHKGHVGEPHEACRDWGYVGAHGREYIGASRGAHRGLWGRRCTLGSSWGGGGGGRSM